MVLFLACISQEAWEFCIGQISSLHSANKQMNLRNPLIYPVLFGQAIEQIENRALIFPLLSFTAII
jgi:hypothetical protein